MVSEKERQKWRLRVLEDAIHFVEVRALKQWIDRFEREYQEHGDDFDKSLGYGCYNRVEEDIRAYKGAWMFTPSEAVTVFELCTETVYFGGKWSGYDWKEKLSERAATIYGSFVQKIAVRLAEYTKMRVAATWRKHIDTVHEREDMILSGLWDAGEISPTRTDPTMKVLVEGSWEECKKLYQERTPIGTDKSERDYLKTLYGF